MVWTPFDEHKLKYDKFIGAIAERTRNFADGNCSDDSAKF